MDKAKIQPGVDFVAHHEDFQEINGLSYTEIGKLFCAILTYTADGTVVEGLSPQAKVIFAFIRRHIDRDKKKYEETRVKRSEAGKLGGRPKKGGSKKQTKANKANGSFAFEEESKKSLPVPVPDPVPVPVPDPIPDPVSDGIGAAAAATYDDGAEEEGFDREKRIRFLQTMMKLHETGALTDEEDRERYKAELDTLVRGG